MQVIRQSSDNSILRLPIRNWNWSINTQMRPAAAFWDYLSGIETLFRRFYNGSHPPFWDYLSGIETPPFKKSQSWTSTNFETTYQELKQWTSRKYKEFQGTFWDYLSGIETIWEYWDQCLAFSILRLPIRNWNMIWKVIISGQNGILRLPIRNWNLGKLEGRPSWPSKNFETTYQELKLILLVTYLLTSLYFETTYQELKRQLPRGNEPKF